MTEPARLRLFVAVEMPEETRRDLRKVIEGLQGALPSERVRWVRPEGIHLTLKFLGAVPAGRVDELADCLSGAVTGGSSFELRPGRLGSFGGRGGLRVIWVGMEGETEALAALAAAVDRSLTGVGFEAESRPFRGHLTLGRVRDRTERAERARIHDLLAKQPPPEIAAFAVGGISLMQSTLGPGGARYDCLRSFPLD
jgi:2'-5' RNA ligase